MRHKPLFASSTGGPSSPGTQTLTRQWVCHLSVNLHHARALSLRTYLDGRSRLQGHVSISPSCWVAVAVCERASEAARVHANDVTSDFYGPVIIVHGKGEVVRLVPISVEVKAVLASAFKVSPFGWAFPNMNDMRLHVTGAALSKACRPYLEGHTFHALRHR